MGEREKIIVSFDADDTTVAIRFFRLPNIPSRFKRHFKKLIVSYTQVKECRDQCHLGLKCIRVPSWEY